MGYVSNYASDIGDTSEYCPIQYSIDGSQIYYPETKFYNRVFQYYSDENLGVPPYNGETLRHLVDTVNIDNFIYSYTDSQHERDLLYSLQNDLESSSSIENAIQVCLEFEDAVLQDVSLSQLQQDRLLKTSAINKYVIAFIGNQDPDLAITWPSGTTAVCFGLATALGWAAPPLGFATGVFCMFNDANGWIKKWD